MFLCFYCPCIKPINLFRNIYNEICDTSQGIYQLLTLADNGSFGPGDPSFTSTCAKQLKCYWQANEVKFHSIYQGESCNNTHHHWLRSMVGIQHANIIQWPVDIHVHKCFIRKRSTICVGGFDASRLFRKVFNLHLISIIRDSTSSARNRFPDTDTSFGDGLALYG